MADNFQSKNTMPYMRIKNALNTLKSTIFGRPVDNFDIRINKALNRVSRHVTNKEILNYSETMKSVLTNSISSNKFDNNIMLNILQNQETQYRWGRYSNAEEIVYCIPHCSRALNVLSNSIISPDSITKDSIKILGGDLSNREQEEFISNLKTIREVLEIDDMIGDVISDTLKYGDQFVEIADFKSEEIPITQSLLLAESEVLDQTNPKDAARLNHLKEDILSSNNKKFPIKYKILKEGELVEEKKDLKLTLTIDHEYKNNLNENKNLSESDILLEKNASKKRDSLVNIQDLRLIVHDIKRVIKIQTKRQTLNLGYLVLPQGGMYSASLQSPSLPGFQSNSATGSTAGIGSSSAYDYGNMFGLDAVYLEIIKMIKKYVRDTSEIEINKQELLKMLEIAIRDMDDNNGPELRVRYVSPERMQHFYITNKTFYPYGESIFQKISFGAKLLIALESAVTMKRISQSTETRLISVESNAPRQVATIINALKDAMYRRKFSLDTMGSVGSIPSMLTSFETIYLPMHNNKKYVEFDTLNPSMNVHEATEELKYFRDQILSGLDVPAAFLNVEENLSNKSILAHESSMFAETILAYQKTFSKHLKFLFSKVYNYVYGQNLPKDVSITFPAPKFLEMEKAAEATEVVSRIVQAGEALNIPKEYFINKYLDIDYDDLNKFLVGKMVRPPEPIDAANQQSQSGQPGGMMPGDQEYGGNAGIPEQGFGPPQ